MHTLVGTVLGLSACSQGVAPSSSTAVFYNERLVTVSTKSGTTMRTMMGCEAGVIKMCFELDNDFIVFKIMVYFFTYIQKRP